MQLHTDCKYVKVLLGYWTLVGTGSDVVSCVKWRIPFIRADGSGFYDPRSLHTDETNVCTGDGSVRFLTGSIDQATNRAIHSINGDEVVGVF